MKVRKIEWKKRAPGCLMVLGAVSFVVFALPLLLSAGLNIGNLTGMAVSVLIFVYGCFFEKINAARRLWKTRKVKRIFVYLAEGLVKIIVVLVILLTILMIVGAANKPKGNETLIVLGCRVYGENASLSLRERLDAAYTYLADHPDTYCVVSGGQGQGENISEAECMYRYLTAKGIEEDRIFKEEESTSTRENLEYSLQVIEENNLPGEVAIATSEYHQYRVSLIAKNLGVENTAVCGRTAIWLFPTFYVRELYGILYELIF